MNRVVLLGLLALAACGDGGGPAKRTAELTKETDALIAQTNELYPPEDHSFRWQYERNVDPMTDKVSRSACIRSSNALMLQSPYEPTRLKLCLRDHPQHGRDVYVLMEKGGQFLYRSYDDGVVAVRFGKGAIQKFTAVGAADGSSEVFFIRNRSRFEQLLKTADVTIIQPEVYEAGTQAISFDTKGFAWPADQSPQPQSKE